jgi:hypothetical protein
VWAIDDLGSALAPHAGHSVRASILEWRASIEMRSDVACGGVAPIISTDTDAAVGGRGRDRVRQPRPELAGPRALARRPRRRRWGALLGDAGQVTLNYVGKRDHGPARGARLGGAVLRAQAAGAPRSSSPRNSARRALAAVPAHSRNRIEHGDVVRVESRVSCDEGESLVPRLGDE